MLANSRTDQVHCCCVSTTKTCWGSVLLSTLSAGVPTTAQQVLITAVPVLLARMATSVWTQNRNWAPGDAITVFLFRLRIPKDLRFRLFRHDLRNMDLRLHTSLSNPSPLHLKFRFVTVRLPKVLSSRRRSDVSTTRLFADTNTRRTVGRHLSTPNTTDATVRWKTSDVWKSEREHWTISTQPMIRTFASCCRSGKNCFHSESIFIYENDSREGFCSLTVRTSVLQFNGQ